MSDKVKNANPAGDAESLDAAAEAAAKPVEAESAAAEPEAGTSFPGEVTDDGTIPFPETEASSSAASEELAAEYLDRLQRLQAEFDNYRKRIQREKEVWRRQTKIGVIRELLPVLDDVNRARTHVVTSKTVPDGEGLMFILKKFADVLSQLGLEEMPTEPGMEFDPERHEALINSPSDEIEEGCIASSLEAGFIFEGEIVRPGKVMVSSGPATD